MRLFDDILTSASFISISQRGWDNLGPLHSQYHFRAGTIWAARVFDLVLTFGILIATVHYLLPENAIWAGLLITVVILLTGLLFPYIIFRFLLLFGAIRPCDTKHQAYNTRDAARTIFDHLKAEGYTSLSHSKVLHLVQEVAAYHDDARNPSEQLINIAKSKGIRGKELGVLYDGEMIYLQKISAIKSDTP